MAFELSTNLSDLPYGTFHQLAQYLDSNDLWQNLFSDNCKDSVYSLTPDEVERFKKTPNPGAQFLRLLGTRGETVKSFLTRLHALAKIYGDVMDRPQLILRRKFCSVIWSRREQVIVICSDKDHLKLQCKASGFPTPRYQWLEEDRPLEGATASSLLILRCPCTARCVFKCKVWNAIEDGHEWSAFYRMKGKCYESELISNVVDLSSYVSSSVNPNCALCNRNNLENIYRMVKKMNVAGNDGECSGNAAALNDMDGVDPMDAAMMTTSSENIACDKVALIISNRTYAPLMSNLITPHCDAESLADALQQLKFKTVTLGDLRIDEMKFIIQEYRKLFGEGVYAVFYFVGHGFEANGQCYLLPIGAPAENYGPDDCLSMDWVMSVFRDCNPALNLILLDICRKFLPSNLEAFNAYAERFRRDAKVNRNTVFGYATSGGVGAYEVRGEINGVFMKYLKNRINQQLPVLDMLNKVFRDIEKDKKVRDVQVPELKSNLTRPRSLLDPLVFDGHTTSYDHHTTHWRLMHELPNPVHLKFAEQRLLVTVWFDFCGHFTNKAYVFSNVSAAETLAEDCATAASNNSNNGGTGTGDSNDNDDNSGGPSKNRLQPAATSAFAPTYLAHLRFSPEFDASQPKIFTDDEEGVSLCVMVSNLQRSKGELRCTVELRMLSPRRTSPAADDAAVADGQPPESDADAQRSADADADVLEEKEEEEKVEPELEEVMVASRKVTLGHVLITRITAPNSPHRSSSST